MSAGVVMYEGFISEDMTTFSASQGTAYKGTVRVPDSRKMLDGSYGSMFKDFVVWPGTAAYRTIERLAGSGKPMNAGSQVKVVLLETEAEYNDQSGSKRIASNYEALDISFVSRSKASASAPSEATATSVVDAPAPAAAPGGITL